MCGLCEKGEVQYYAMWVKLLDSLEELKLSSIFTLDLTAVDASGYPGPRHWEGSAYAKLHSRLFEEAFGSYSVSR
jgi:hypothetical protein